MANSATLLADLIERWTVPANQVPEKVRGVRVDSIETWSEHIKAVRWLAEIEDALLAMEAMGEDTRHFRDSQAAWYAAIFGLTAPWGSGVNAPLRIADRRDVGLLRALGQQLDSVRFTPRIDAVDLEALRATLQDVHELVVKASVDDSVRRYVLGLLAEARRVLDDLAAFGEVRLRDVTFALSGAMSAAAESAVPEGERESWRSAARRIVAQIAIQGTASALGTLATLPMITG